MTTPPALPPTASGFPRLRIPSAAGIVAVVATLMTIGVLVAGGDAKFGLFTGLILAFLPAPIVTWLSARRVPRGIATLLTMVVFFAVVISLIVAFLGVVTSQAAAFLQSLPEAFANIEAWVKTLGLAPNTEADILAFVNNIEQTLASFDITALFAPLVNLGVAFLGSFFTLITLPFFMFYVLAGRPSLARSLYGSAPAAGGAGPPTGGRRPRGD